MNRLALTRDQLNVLMADIARRSPHVMPILRGVHAGAIGYLELTYRGSRVLRLGPAGSLPMVTLIADGEGRGPAPFRLSFLQHLFARAAAVAVVCDEQDGFAYDGGGGPRHGDQAARRAGRMPAPGDRRLDGLRLRGRRATRQSVRLHLRTGDAGRARVHGT
jgi:hypothetical protein